MSSNNQKKLRTKTISCETSTPLERRLLAYAVAAAGAVTVAFPSSAHAQVVYTKADITITEGFLPIDLDHDGVTDFALFNSENDCCYFYGGRLQIFGDQNEAPAVLGKKQIRAGYRVLAVPQGVSIGSNSPASFVDAASGQLPVLATAYATYFGRGVSGGYWLNVGEKYVGLRFVLNGQTHYGWIRLSVNANTRHVPTITVKMTGYAYETTPDKAIAAGYRGFTTDGSTAAASTPASLGVLSLGAVGLDAWRTSGLSTKWHSGK